MTIREVRFRLLLFGAFALLTLQSQDAKAQLFPGRISGRVRDAQGAVVASATVKLTNPATGLERTVTTDESVPVEEGLVISRCETLASRFDEHGLGATRLLGHPDVPHGRELEFAQHNLLPLAERKRAGQRIHSGGCTRDQRDFVHFRAYKIRKYCSRRFVMFHPKVPRRALFVPSTQILQQSCLHTVGERTLRAAIEVDLGTKNREARSNGGNLG